MHSSHMANKASFNHKKKTVMVSNKTNIESELICMCKQKVKSGGQYAAGSVNYFEYLA